MGYIFDAMNRKRRRRADAVTPAPASADQGRQTLREAQAEAEAQTDGMGPLPFPADELSDQASTGRLADMDPFDEADGDGDGPDAADRGQAADGRESRHAFVPITAGANVDERLIALTQPGSVMAEEYRAIRTGLLARWKQCRHLIHTITSATPQEGKTITTLNLGLIFAEMTSRRTLVIEADLRLPQFPRLLPLEDRPGLVNVLRGEAEVDDCIQEVGDYGLHVLPGRRAGNAAVQLLSGPALPALLRRLRARYDHVLIDTPPVVELADAGIIGALSDDVLLIARLNRTPKTLVEQAIRILQAYEAPIAGVIGTDQQSLGLRYGRYGNYGYRSRYANTSSRAPAPVAARPPRQRRPAAHAA